MKTVIRIPLGWTLRWEDIRNENKEKKRRVDTIKADIAQKISDSVALGYNSFSVDYLIPSSVATYLRILGYRVEGSLIIW